MDGELTHLDCRCGQCRISLTDPKMRAHTQCFCRDCRQRTLISQSAGTMNPMPKAVADFERGVDLMYFSNAMIVSDASCDLLEFRKLTEDGMNTTAYAKCCGTVMCGVHPLFAGTTISVNADNCRVTVSEALPVEAVVFLADAPPEKAEKVEARAQAPVFYDVFKEIEHPVLQAFVASVSAPIDPAATALATTNFETLCDANTVTIDNSCFEASRAG